MPELDRIHPFEGRELLKKIDELFDKTYRVNLVFVGSGMSIEDYRIAVAIQRRKLLAKLVGEILFDLAGGGDY
jgi:hypothetical protein